MTERAEHHGTGGPEADGWKADGLPRRSHGVSRPEMERLLQGPVDALLELYVDVTCLPGPVKRRVRDVLLAAQDHRCGYCARALRAEAATLDHRHPRALGGRNQRDNLLVACEPCNTAKGHRVGADGADAGELIRAVRRRGARLVRRRIRQRTRAAQELARREAAASGGMAVA